MATPTRRRCDAPQEPEDSAIRVLIADDDPNFCAYLTALTNRLGLVSEIVNDGETATERLQSGRFHLLLCDFEMPRLNGLEVIAAIRGNARTSSVYAVMLTAHDDLALKVHALSLGFDDFLSKACTEVEVVAKVSAARRMLARQRQLDAAVREWKGIASRDELTGVFSRRFFFDEAARCLGEKRDIGVILFDLDNFKKINDTLGHVAGDEVLRDVGRLFLRITRHDDVIARYGGDEFVLLVSDLSMEETWAVAERLQRQIASSPIAPQGADPITASVGVGFSALIADATVNLVLEAADRDLYARKWLRKNPSAVRAEAYEYPPQLAAGEVLTIQSRRPAKRSNRSTAPPGAEIQEDIK